MIKIVTYICVATSLTSTSVLSCTDLKLNQK
ncbi:hypothetical protein PAMA111031_05710 [Paraphotobacterium marinum]